MVSESERKEEFNPVLYLAKEVLVAQAAANVSKQFQKATVDHGGGRADESC